VHPRELSAEQMEKITRRFTAELIRKQFIRSRHQRPGAGLRHGRARDGLDRRHGLYDVRCHDGPGLQRWTHMACVTGKPVTPGRHRGAHARPTRPRRGVCPARAVPPSAEVKRVKLAEARGPAHLGDGLSATRGLPREPRGASAAPDQTGADRRRRRVGWRRCTTPAGIDIPGPAASPREDPLDRRDSFRGPKTLPNRRPTAWK